MPKIRKSDSFDTEFRRVVMEHIQRAEKSIKVRTGEIASYDFLDLRMGAEDAAERGVKTKVYATRPNKNIVNRLIHHGVDIHIGKVDSEDHFMIIDDAKVIRSIKEKGRKIPTPMGAHKFQVIDEPKKVREFVKLFEKLVNEKSSKKQKSEGSDPLKDALGEASPLSYT